MAFVKTDAWHLLKQMHGMVYRRHVWRLNTDTPCMALNTERRQAWRLYGENINDYKYVGKQIQ